MGLLFFLFYLLIIPCLQGQENNTLGGKMLFLSSGKSPAKGVEIAGSIEGTTKANTVYTLNDGAYHLVFQTAKTGHRVQLTIGNIDGEGKSIELVNDKEIANCRIPANATDEFEIIVCRKGERDLTAQRYYKIIKTSSDIALAQKENEYKQLLLVTKKDYEKIATLSAELANLQQQTDSLAIYKEAFSIASINKDNASQRVLRYLQLLEEGKSIQQAREALSIQNAAKDLDKSERLFKSAIEELERRAGASVAIFDFHDAIICYDTIISYSLKMNIDRLILSELYINAATINLFVRHDKRALEYNQKAIACRVEILNPNHLDLATSYFNIALTYRAMGQYEKALEYNQKAMSIQEEILDPGHPDLATSYDQIGSVYLEMGQSKKALEYIQKAMSIREEILDPKDPFFLATSYNNIALTYQALGQYNKALEYLEKSISIQEETLDPNHLGLATPYSNIALIYQALGQYNRALEYLEKSISIQEETLDPRHPSLAISYGNIGGIYQAMGQYEKALEYYQKSIGIQEEILNPKDPFLATSYNNLALTYQALGQFKKALEYQEKSIGILEETLDPRHPSLAISYGNIGGIYQAIGHYEKALEYHQKSIGIQEEILDPNHPSLGFSYSTIAITYMKAKEFAKAITFQEKCLEIFKAAFPESHPNQQMAFSVWLEIYNAKALDAFEKKEYAVALQSFDTLNLYGSNGDIWNFTGLYHYYLSEYTKAIEAYQKAANISPNQKTPSFYNNIGAAYAKNGQFEEAHTAFNEYQKLLPHDGRTYRNWAIYHTLQGDKEKALQSLQRAVELGYDDLKWFETDDSMDSLRAQKAFKQIIEKLGKEKNK